MEQMGMMLILDGERYADPDDMHCQATLIDHRGRELASRELRRVFRLNDLRAMMDGCGRHGVVTEWYVDDATGQKLKTGVQYCYREDGHLGAHGRPGSRYLAQIGAWPVH